jgi:hypothetical protein
VSKAVQESANPHYNLQTKRQKSVGKIFTGQDIIGRSIYTLESLLTEMVPSNRRSFQSSKVWQ